MKEFVVMVIEQRQVEYIVAGKDEDDVRRKIDKHEPETFSQPTGVDSYYGLERIESIEENV